MAPSTVACHENAALATFLSGKRDELRQPGSGQDSGKLDAVYQKAFKSVCLYKDPILSLQQARKVRGIGNWLLNILKSEFFQEENDSQQPADDGPARVAKAPRRYLPQKNSAPYAILITLHRTTAQGEKEFMFKQELIQAADSSGLSSKPIEPGRGSGATGRFGDSTKDWYSGWSSMKTLISKGLVIKSNCPARYKLTLEGSKIAEECMARSGLDVGQAFHSQPASVEVEVTKSTSRGRARVKGGSTRKTAVAAGTGTTCASKPSLGEAELTNLDSYSRAQSVNSHLTTEHFRKLKGMGFGDEAIEEALKEAVSLSDSGSLWEVALECLLGEVPASAKWQTSHPEQRAAPCPTSAKDYVAPRPPARGSQVINRPPIPSVRIGAPAARDCTVNEVSSNSLNMPPLKNGQKFQDLYDVILILDDREQYAREGSSSSRKFADRLMGLYNVEVAVRHMPVGDAAWIARHRVSRAEYVLDFIVERKRVDDLWISIKDKRYKEQKFRLKRCGIKKLIYLIEGDPNLIDATEALKTAAFSTELADGFDVQRTTDAHETMKRYGELTAAITARYAMESNTSAVVRGGCLTFGDFLNHCKDLDKERVSDVFGVQLTQVKLVTEDIALSILDKYPTLADLARAYTALEGNLSAQEDMLKGLPIRNKKKTISSAISKNLYRFIWAPSTGD